uniref:Uncharacterized protein n=1 Tax=Arundo donax TaxID=35708 RepID=A0A0A8ZR25_ARUDO
MTPLRRTQAGMRDRLLPHLPPPSPATDSTPASD